MKKKINIITTLSIVVTVLGLQGCGEDRSTLYDGSGNKIVSLGKKVSWIYDTTDGKKMIANNFVYIPGGFDVDGDQVPEEGFWLAKYEARETNQTINLDNIGTISDIIRDSFLVYNKETRKFDQQVDINNSYLNIPLSTLQGFSANKVLFSADGTPVSSYSPIEAVVALAHSQVDNARWHITLPSEKQWMQIVQLVINNKENWSGEIGKGKIFQGTTFKAKEKRDFVIANNLLGQDTHVPLDYKVHVYDLSGNLAEWTNGMIAKKDRFLGGDAGEVEYTTLGNDTPKWWIPILNGESVPLTSLYGAGKYYDGSTLNGTTDVLNITGNTGDVDDFAVVARGGSFTEADQTLVGISAAKLNYGPGFKDPTLGFRAASGYVGE